MSEKMDGIRAYWDGFSLWSRHGKQIQTPEKFIQGLPVISLDGELWMGRGSWEKLMQLIRSKELKSTMDGPWNQVKYYIFDLPTSPDPYEDRMEQMKLLLLPSNAAVVRSTQCTGKPHLISYLNDVLIGCGEGIMLREPFSLYTSGITSSLLKVKVNQYFVTTEVQRVTDAEVTVLQTLNTGLFCIQYEDGGHHF